MNADLLDAIRSSAVDDIRMIREGLAEKSELMESLRGCCCIIEKTNILEEYPMIGRKVPEIDDENIREIFAYSYRILYEIKSDKVYIIGIIHGRRDFTSTNVYRIKEPDNRP